MNTLQVFKALYADSRKVFEAPDVDFGRVIEGRSGWLRERARYLDGKIVFEYFDGTWRFSDEISKRDDWRMVGVKKVRVTVGTIIHGGEAWQWSIRPSLLDKSKTYKLVAVEE